MGLARTVVAVGGFGIGVVYVMALSVTVEGLERRTRGWTAAVSEEHSKYRRNVKRVAFVGLAPLLMVSLTSGLVGVAAAGGFGIFLVIVSMLFLETGLTRLGKAIRAELRAEG